MVDPFLFEDGGTYVGRRNDGNDTDVMVTRSGLKTEETPMYNIRNMTAGMRLER